jgi:basic amino acid/polyamine antiporter, APA family
VGNQLNAPDFVDTVGVPDTLSGMATAREQFPAERTPTLGLTGATVNAMALIAPGAFLWITYQLQAAATAPDGTSVARDMWPGILLALVIALLSAVSYAELARRYPEAGFGGCYFFAEKAFIDRENGRHHRWARIAKLVTGWAAHLYYWVYPGTMVAFMATLVGYIYAQVTGGTMSGVALVMFSVAFAVLAGWVAVRGITGSTLTATVINVVQLVTLVVFTTLAIVYRLHDAGGGNHWVFATAGDIVRPHTLQGVLIQSTLAILILVGFESCTALAAETRDAGRNIPRAVILSLVIQGAFAYLFEYFGANYMLSDALTGSDTHHAALTGLDAAAASSAPLGDLAILVGNRLLGGLGFGLMITIAVTVVLALLASTLSCMNTAARVSYAMARDREMPELLGALHGRFASPARAIWALVVVSCVIAAIGVQSVVGLTGITLASNFGTFALYGMTCLWTLIAFAGRRDARLVRHVVVPILGVIANAAMLAAIIYLYVVGNADSKKEAYICFAIAGAWAALSVAYVIIVSVRERRPLVGVAG